MQRLLVSLLIAANLLVSADCFACAAQRHCLRVAGANLPVPDKNVDGVYPVFLPFDDIDFSCEEGDKLLLAGNFTAAVRIYSEKIENFLKTRSKESKIRLLVMLYLRKAYAESLSVNLAEAKLDLAHAKTISDQKGFTSDQKMHFAIIRTKILRESNLFSESADSIDDWVPAVSFERSFEVILRRLSGEESSYKASLDRYAQYCPLCCPIGQSKFPDWFLSKKPAQPSEDFLSGMAQLYFRIGRGIGRISPIQQIKFNSSLWKSSFDLTSTTRVSMLTDLIYTGNLLGKSRSVLHDMLGPPSIDAIRIENRLDSDLYPIAAEPRDLLSRKGLRTKSWAVIYLRFKYNVDEQASMIDWGVFEPTAD